jgi:hypothetical protein
MDFFATQQLESHQRVQGMFCYSMFRRCGFADSLYLAELSESNMSSFIHRKSKPKEEDAIPSGFTFSHAKDILSIAVNVSKIAQIPHLESAAEIAKKIVEIVEARIQFNFFVAI